MHSAKVAAQIRAQIRRFSGEVSVGLPKTAARLVREVIYGVQSRASVRLSEIARALEEGIRLKKVVERLSRQLKRKGLRQQVRRNLLELAAPRVGRETLLVVDLTDVSKRYARQMEYLARVRDGSRGELRDGYWCCQVVGVERGSAEVMLLDQELYSQEAPDFISENDEILKAIERVSKATQGRGVWVMDRGGDRQKILKVLLNQGHRFVFRQRGDRHLISGRQRKSVREWADGCRRRYREVVIKETSSGETVYDLEFGARKVRWPGRTEPLTLVVVDGLGQNPLMLLTNRKVTRSRKSLWRIVKSYLSRWRVEETIRFIKQSYGLEDIRVLKYERLRNLAMLVLVTAYFASVYLGKRAKLAILVQHIERAAKRIYGVPEFRFYAIADGIKQLLYGRAAGIGPPPPGSRTNLLPLFA